MELSVKPVQHQQCDAEQAAGEPRPRVAMFDVRLPADLRQFGHSVRARTVGNPLHPPVVALGGISGNCFVCTQADGSGGWWRGLVGNDCAIDPQRHYVIGMDFAADNNGQAAPSTADQARVLAAALDCIGVQAQCTIVGASYGGMVGLALAETMPERVERLVLISAGAEPHPAATAARELQRRVVELGLEAGRGEAALEIARGMGMLTYRTAAEFGERFAGGIDAADPLTRSAPGDYLRARGKSFLGVMSPGRFLSLSASIDRHCIHPEQITAACLLVGANSDQLVLAEQLRRLGSALAGPVELHLLDSLYGHDMFLKEAERIGRLVSPFLDPAL